MTRRVLVLGGTAEARGLAGALDDAGVAVISSLAGRVSQPRLPPGEVRIGGFGGPAELARWLSEQAIGAVVDATHPFAERISASAGLATASAGVPLLRLERPGWKAREGDHWTWVGNLAQAAAKIRTLGARRVLLTTGRQGLAAFAADHETWFLIRCVDPPRVELPRRNRVLLARGPYTVEGELALIDSEAIDLLVTKDSGGSLTEAKLRAARIRGLPVVVVRRPARPEGQALRTVDDALRWVQTVLSVDPDRGAERHQVAEFEHRRVLDTDTAV